MYIMHEYAIQVTKWCTFLCSARYMATAILPSSKKPYTRPLYSTHMCNQVFTRVLLLTPHSQLVAS